MRRRDPTALRSTGQEEQYRAGLALQVNRLGDRLLLLCLHVLPSYYVIFCG